LKRTLLRIGGELRDGKDVEAVINPFDGSQVGEVVVARPADMQDAVTRAAVAFGGMRDLPTHRRVAILEACAQGIEARADELAQGITEESGKPIRYSRGEVRRAAVTFGLGAAAARQALGEVLPVDLEARAEGRLGLYQRVPRGPVAAIAPFNFPLNLVAHKLSPAVAVGTSAVLKPPPQAPLTAHRLADILLAAGLPEDALSVLHCPPAVAQQMVTDSRMKVLSFTGSDAVGWRLKALAGPKQVLLELGGNAPCVIDEGADLDRALPAILQGAWAHAGQVCIKVQRVYCHASMHDAFLERFVAETRELACGDPTDENTVVGPLIEAQQVTRVLDWIGEAVEAGATLHCGGEAEGRVVRPAILTGVPETARVCRDEVFGPVTVVERFDDFDAVLGACNRTRYGLQVGLFTPDIARALRAFRALDYGGVIVNDVPTFRTDNTPYGGTKDSGIGREGVGFAMEAYCEPKLLVLRAP